MICQKACGRGSFLGKQISIVETYCNVFPQEMCNSTGAAVTARAPKWKVLTSDISLQTFLHPTKVAVSSGQFQTVPVEAGEA